MFKTIRNGVIILTSYIRSVTHLLTSRIGEREICQNFSLTKNILNLSGLELSLHIMS
jgi:hypothetical protein